MPSPIPSNSGSLYATSPEDVELSAPGWVEWEGLTVSPLPVKDAKTGLFARLRYRDAATAAAKLGARMLTKEEIDLIHSKGFEIKPVTLVHSQADGMRMGTIEFARKHDDEVWRQLKALGWDGRTPVSNAGKHWLPGAPKGRAINYGWFSPSAKFGVIQTPGGAHDENHVDYSQLLMVVK